MILVAAIAGSDGGDGSSVVTQASIDEIRQQSDRQIKIVNARMDQLSQKLDKAMATIDNVAEKLLAKFDVEP